MYMTPMGQASHYGWPAKDSPMYMGGGGGVSRHVNVFQEPVHAHRFSHQVAVFFGGNPLDVEDFDARLEVFLGKEHEMHVLDTPSVIHYVPGMVHMGDEIRYVNKPMAHIMWVIGPEMEDYYAAAPRDKVLLSDESKGEIMIPEGAHDYVPPTKLEDWVWPYTKDDPGNMKLFAVKKKK